MAVLELQGRAFDPVVKMPLGYHIPNEVQVQAPALCSSFLLMVTLQTEAAGDGSITLVSANPVGDPG